MAERDVLEDALMTVGRWLGRMVRQVQEWIDPSVKQPRIIWIDRSDTVPYRNKRAGQADVITGRIIRETDRICVCKNCDATYLKSSWYEAAPSLKNRCVTCGAIGTVRDE